MSLKEKTQTLFAENSATLPPTLFRRQAAST
jgi:hypothetical protein